MGRQARETDGRLSITGGGSGTSYVLMNCVIKNAGIQRTHDFTQASMMENRAKWWKW